MSITVGKLFGRLGYETSITPAQTAFSIIISTQLSMAAIVLGYRLPSALTTRWKAKLNDFWLETYAALAVMFWFALIPGVDMIGNDTYSNLLRAAMAMENSGETGGTTIG